eukprot:3852639-Pyramimonas_sp.AAC.3
MRLVLSSVAPVCAPGLMCVVIVALLPLMFVHIDWLGSMLSSPDGTRPLTSKYIAYRLDVWCVKRQTRKRANAKGVENEQ